MSTWHQPYMSLSPSSTVSSPPASGTQHGRPGEGQGGETSEQGSQGMLWEVQCSLSRTLGTTSSLSGFSIEVLVQAPSQPLGPSCQGHADLDLTCDSDNELDAYLLCVSFPGLS